MNYEASFQPMHIGKMLIKNRLIVPAMDSGMANPNGSISEKTVGYYAARARGGFGMVITEIAAIERRGMGMPCQIDISSDDTIPGLKTLADGIKSYGSRAVVQLHHAGRETVAALAMEQPAAPSSVPCPVNRETPHEFSTEEVYEIIDKYINSAIRAQKAGFDAVEIHAAHGYLGGQFLSPRSNKRIDEFGGSIAGRCYFLKLIVEGIKEKCGKDYPVIVRISTNESRIGGIRENEAIVHAQLLESFGVDALDLSAGTYGAWDVIVPPPETEQGWNLSMVRKIKSAVNIPVIAVGKFSDPDLIELAILREDTDFIALGRQSIADPEFPNKMFSGNPLEIVPCLSCTQRCMSFNDPANLQEGDMGVSCALNPFSNDREEIRLTPTKVVKNVMVVGAGPAGLEAAWIAAKRGHKVSLYEKNPENRAGGQFLIASYPPFKQDLTRAIRHYVYMCKKYGVDMHFNTEVDETFMKQQNPDVLIIATGATPKKPNLPGADGKNIKAANDVLMGEPVSGNVLIVGGGLVGVETAEYCSDYCDKVTIVKRKNVIAPELYMTVRDSMLRRFKKEEIEVLTGVKVLGFKENGIICERNNEEVEMNGYDSIIIAMGAEAYNPFSEPEKLAKEVYVIGDAKEARSVIEAVFEAAKISLEI